MNKWLSFIVPIYNAEQYLAECVESMLNQDVPQEQYEIILLDDGSTDCSLEIAHSYAKQHNCIHIYSQTNAGVAATRNTGIAKASGDYIWFVDSDDKIAINILSTIYKQVTDNNLDLLVFNASRFNEDREWAFTNIAEMPVTTGIQFYMNNNCNIEPWNKIFRRSLLVDNSLSFKFRLAEDTELIPLCFFHARRMKASCINAYFNRTHDGSLTRSGNQELWSEFNLKCLQSHIDYMNSRSNPDFWMRVLVTDTRYVYWGMTNFPVNANFRKQILDQLGKILRDTLKTLPVTFNTNYLILQSSARFPNLVMKSLCILRNLKKLVKK